jgi:hypothetical protein
VPSIYTARVGTAADPSPKIRRQLTAHPECPSLYSTIPFDV